MKEKILKEAMDWYDKQDNKDTVFIEDFINLVIDKTTDTIFDGIKDEFENEFKKGNLKHSYIISSDYYLYLKFKEIKDKILKAKKLDISTLKDESKKFD
jgi:hypothetical protein